MALVLCYKAIQADRVDAERHAAATWYTQQAVIVHGSSRKGRRGRLTEELGGSPFERPAGLLL
jgi:hypothetical protein